MQTNLSLILIDMFLKYTINVLPHIFTASIMKKKNTF